MQCLRPTHAIQFNFYTRGRMETYQHRFDCIEDYLHHRPPYLLVQEIDQLEHGEIWTSMKVGDNDPFLAGHFPGAPVFPGALMQELVTQSAGILIAANHNPMEQYNTHQPDHNRFALGVLVKVNQARYRKFARPGDLLRVNVRLVENEGMAFRFKGFVHVAESEIMTIQFMLANIESKQLAAV